MSAVLADALPVERSARRWILPGKVVFGVACLALWHLGYQALGREWLPSPALVTGRILDLASAGTLLHHTLVTFGEAAGGMVLGGATGAALPLLLRLSPRLLAALDPFIAAAFGLPKLALAPLFILWFGIGLTAKVIFVASVVFFLLFYNGLAGIMSVDPRLVAMARVAGASEWRITREIVWNTTVPFLFAGLKIALPRALGAAVVGEFIGADAGLGWYINRSRSMADPTGVLAGVVVVTALVILVNAALQRVQARSLAWRPVARDMVV